jgi:hypothetical protein
MDIASRPTMSAALPQSHKHEARSVPFFHGRFTFASERANALAHFYNLQKASGAREINAFLILRSRTSR